MKTYEIDSKDLKDCNKKGSTTVNVITLQDHKKALKAQAEEIQQIIHGFYNERKKKEGLASLQNMIVDEIRLKIDKHLGEREE